MKQIITAQLYLLKSIFQTFVCMYIRKLYTHLLLVLHNTRDVHVQCHYILYMYNATTYCTCTCTMPLHTVHVYCMKYNSQLESITLQKP